MYNYEYEEFLADCYPDFKSVFEIPQPSTCLLDLAPSRAIRYLEMTCSAAYGFPSDVYHTSDMGRLKVGLMPSVYESSLCLELLKDQPIHPSVIDTLQRVILEGRQPATGLWNFYNCGTDTASKCFPDDIDDTVLSSAALYHLGKFSLDDCRRIANDMLDSIIIGPTGGMATWIQNSKWEGSRKILMDSRLLGRPLEDISSMTNTLWFLTEIGMEGDERAISSLNCIDKFLDEHMMDVNAVLRHYMIYYTDRFIMYFIIARYVEKSDRAKKAFGPKFAALLKTALMGMSIQDSSAHQVSCCVMAAMKLGFHKDNFQHLTPMEPGDVQRARTKIETLFKVILNHQAEDGSFPAWKVFRWGRRGYFGGSRAVTTAFALQAMKMVRREILGEGKVYTEKDLEIY